MEIRKVFSTIQDANDEIKNSWENIYEISSLLEDKKSSEIAFRRTISYDPSNQQMISSYASSTNSRIDEVVNAITKILAGFTESIQTNPNNISQWIIAAHSYALLGDFTNAYSAYSNVIRLIKDTVIEDPYFWYGIGSVFQHFNYHKTALQYLYTANELANKLPLSADVNFRIALSHRNLKNYHESIQYFELLINTQSYPSYLTQDDIMFQLAYTNQLMGKTEIAKQIYNELYQNNPKNSDIIQQYCWFLLLLGDKLSVDLAENIINKFNPNEPTLLLILARIAMKKNEMTLAHNRYCACISYWNYSPLFWGGIGVLYCLNAQDQDAIVAFQRAVFLNPDLQEIWLNLALIFELREDLPRILQMYEIAIEQCPHNEKLRERYAAIQNKRAKPPDRSMILEINDSKLFPQIAEKISNGFINTPPAIPPNQIGAEIDEDTFNKSLKLFHNSMFSI